MVPRDGLVNRLVERAQANMKACGDMKSYHAAAVVSKGSKVLSYGINHPRTYVRGRVGLTVHAEEDALLDLYVRYLRWSASSKTWHLLAPAKVAED